MSYLFINHSLETFTPTVSGAIATHIWECSRAAQRQGLSPVVLSVRGTAEPHGDVNTILLDYPQVPKRGLRFRLLRAHRRLSGWRHLGQRRHAANVAKAIREHGLQDLPMILHNDPELAVYLRAKFPKAYLIHHFHNQIETAHPFRRSFPSSVNVITAVSHFTSRWVENHFALKRGTVQTVYNGVDCAHFTPAQNPHHGSPIINFLGRTGIEKAPDLVLQAAMELAPGASPFGVQILGSNHWNTFELDDYQRLLQSLSGQLESQGIPVRRAGHVSRALLPTELRRADIHVVPSRWDEPFALTILEGMACGLATVVAKTGGAPEVVGDAGMLFERDSVNGLASRLRQFLADENLRADYAHRARNRARQFTWDKTWSCFHSLIEN